MKEAKIKIGLVLAGGGLNKLLDFSPERIQLLQNRGYQDAKRILEPILQLEFGLTGI